jgi:chaperone required for assembly of F1-ATPase
MSDAPKPPHAAPGKPVRTPLPRRFYEQATVGERDGAYALLLDGRGARTPARKPLAVPSRPVAEALAAEWEAQGEYIDPATMPLTRIVNSALDGVASQMDAVRDEIVRYAGSDLICYRADSPSALVERQDAAWSPLVAFARETLGARLVLAEGIVHVEQDRTVFDAISLAIADYDSVALAALHTIMTLTGSAIIALAVARGRLSAEEAWAAAHVDEDFQMEQWGRDEMALQRRAHRWREMQAAALIVGAGRA